VIWIVVLVVLVLVVLIGLVALYNRLVRARNRVDNAWGQIEVQLKRRWDLIPNLVETVKGYAAHERGVFDEVTEARTRAQQASSPAESAQAEGVLSQALGRLFAVAEAYPDLKATQNFQELQAQLSETEDKVAISRQVYNDTVLTYNNAIQTFPGAVVAGPFGFTKREFFEVEEEAQREAPVVDFERS
jgi:LemA protein